MKIEELIRVFGEERAIKQIINNFQSEIRPYVEKLNELSMKRVYVKPDYNSNIIYLVNENDIVTAKTQIEIESILLNIIIEIKNRYAENYEPYIKF